MEVFEYYGQIMESGQLSLPVQIRERLPVKEKVRVMVFLDQNDSCWEKTSTHSFLGGYGLGAPASMMRYQFGDVLLVSWEKNGPATIKRPAVVLYDNGDRELLVCAVTGKPRFMPTDFKISSWKEAGLLDDSYVRTAKLFSFPKHMIDRKLGELTVEDTWWLQQILRRMFDV